MKYLFFGTLVFFAPNFAHAQTVLSIINAATDVMGDFVKVGTALALLVFVYGVVRMIIGMNTGQDGKEPREKGKQLMIWGIVGLFVIVSVWGLVALLGQMFGVTTNNSTQDAPLFKYSR